MQQNYRFVSILGMFKALPLLVTALLFALSPTALAQTTVQVPSFSSVELHNGGRVVIRYGQAPRVTLIKGSLEYTKVSTEDGGRLVVRKCGGECPRGYQVEVEVVTPQVVGISVANGGTIQLQDSFPAQTEIRVGVQQGGTIDIRQMTADRVIASVEQGGRIFTAVRNGLSAKVVQGGLIQYWGDPRVEKSVSHGGVISKGDADDADRPLEKIGESLPSAPPVPPVLRPPQIRRDR